MKPLRNTLLVLSFLTSTTGGKLRAATIASLNLSGAAAIAAGQRLTVTETFFASPTTETEFDTVIGFDPTVFSVSNFVTSSTFSSWTILTNLSPAAGIYDYGIRGPALALAGGGHSVFSFTLTALANAVAGPSNILILDHDGHGYATQVLNVAVAKSLNPAPTNGYDPSIDIQVNVSSTATPEPATFLVGGITLGGIVIFKRRRSHHTVASI